MNIQTTDLHSLANPQPKERGQLCPREQGVMARSGNTRTRLSALLNFETFAR